MKEKSEEREQELSNYTEWCKWASYFLKEARFVMDDESIEKWAKALISAVVEPIRKSKAIARTWTRTSKKVTIFLKFHTFILTVKNQIFTFSLFFVILSHR